MAKCRALYGKRLTLQDYNNLMNCKGINDIVSYLKARTVYSSVFESANSDMSSFQVEELLKIHLLESFEKVSKYEISTGVEFYKYFIIKNDIQQILRFLHFLIIGKPGDYLKVLPPFFNKRSELDLYKLAQARNFGEMIKALSGTEYAKALAPYKDTFTQPECYLKMECSLDRIMWDFERDIVKKYSGKAKEKIVEIIGYENDMENLVRIYRLKRLADSETEDIKNYINLNYTHFTKKNIDDMLSKNTAREMLSEASESYYKKNFSDREKFVSLEDLTQRILYDKLHREVRYSTVPVAVMICYFFLAQNEVKNIIHIVEGLRNGMSQEAIGATLVGICD